MFDSQSRPRELLGRRAASAACGEVLWAALADPAARTAPTAPAPDAPRADHTDHWSPLLTLTLAVLGWSRPDVGVTRWLAEGMRRDDLPLELLASWYGPRAEALVAWSRASSALTDHATRLSDELRLPVPVGRVPIAVHDEHYPGLSGAGYDDLHLGRVPDHLSGPTLDDGELVVTPVPGGEEAVLQLEDYPGWYRLLHEKAGELRLPPPGQERRIEVVVAPLGSLGVFRRSPLTGRWHATSEAAHRYGWPTLR